MCEIAFGVDTGSLKLSMHGDKHKVLEAFDAAQQTVYIRHAIPGFIWRTLAALKIGEQGQLSTHMSVLKSFLAKIVKSRRDEIEHTAEPNGNEAGAHSFF
jgi:hypothetical protein